MKIDQLKVPFLELSEENKFFLVRKIRDERRNIIDAKKRKEAAGNGTRRGKGTRSASAEIKSKVKDLKLSPELLLKTLSKSEKEKLLKELGAI